MRSHARNNKRGRGNKGQDDEHYIGAPVEDMRSETYTRPHESSRHGDNYRASTSSNRSSQYDLGREPPSRGRRHMQEWRREDEVERHVYIPGDVYHRLGSGHDDHGVLDTREPESWPPPGQYSGSRGDWSQPYDYGAYPPSSYAESSSRNASILPRDSRTAQMDHWREADRQMLPPGDRHLSRESPNWRQDQHRDKHGQKYQSDSGWDPHRRTRAWEEPPTAAWDDLTEKAHRIVNNERSWDPAPGWKPPTHHKTDDTYLDAYSRAPRVSTAAPTSTTTSRRNSFSYSTNMKSSSKRTKQPKRDWRDRDDDGPLNNWQRREVPGISTSKPPPRKKQRRSPSLSRSPSPVRSYRSPSPAWEPDRSRSRSHSPTSKRQRRGDTPPVSHTRTFGDKERGRSSNWVPNSRARSSYSPRSPTHSHHSTSDRVRANHYPISRHGRDRSPVSPRSYSGDRGRPILRPNSRYAKEASPSPKGSPVGYSRRRRSVSSASSASSERSPSQSPPGRVRAVHRLPPANANVVSPTITPRPTATTLLNSGTQNNGNAHANGKTHNGERRKGRPSMKALHLDAMPPPAIVPSYSSRTYPPTEEDLAIPTSYNPPQPIPLQRIPEPTPDQSPAFSGFAPIRNAGFKPIGQANSSLKKFFPGDEDDADASQNDPRRKGMPARPIEEETHDTSQTPSPTNSRPAPIHHERKVWPSPPPALSPSRHPLPAPRVEQTIPRPYANAPVFVPAESSQQLPSVDPRPHRSITPLEVKSVPDLPPAPSPESPIELYNIIRHVGEGTFGKVYKAQNTVSKVYVALKRIRMESEKDGFPVTAMREIKLLQSLQHPNVVRLHEMMVATGMWAVDHLFALLMDF
ncbi:hypothetical protein H0H87_002608 [Tephrocybe sp. NHM501043]|nr:hypothetical protein H0H87_002608 [Tephrocybe sp. NHM501043]